MYIPAQEKEMGGRKTQEISFDLMLPLFPLEEQMTMGTKGDTLTNAIRKSIEDEGLICPFTVVAINNDFLHRINLLPTEEAMRRWSIVNNRMIINEYEYPKDSSYIYGVYVGNQRYEILKEMGCTSTDVIVFTIKDLTEMIGFSASSIALETEDVVIAREKEKNEIAERS